MPGFDLTCLDLPPSLHITLTLNQLTAAAAAAVSFSLLPKRREREREDEEAARTLSPSLLPPFLPSFPLSPSPSLSPRGFEARGEEGGGTGRLGDRAFVPSNRLPSIDSVVAQGKAKQEREGEGGGETYAVLTYSLTHSSSQRKRDR